MFGFYAAAHILRQFVAARQCTDIHTSVHSREGFFHKETFDAFDWNHNVTIATRVGIMS